MKRKVLLSLALFAVGFLGLTQSAQAMSTGVWVWVSNAGGGTCEPTDSNPQGQIPYNGYAYFIPGKTYWFNVGQADMSSGTPTYVSFYPGAGYSVYINGMKQNTIGNSLSGPITCTLRVAGPAESFDGRAGTCTSFRPGEIFWQVSLGQTMANEPGTPLRNVNTPLTLSWGKEKTDDWSEVWTPACITTSCSCSSTTGGCGVGPEAAYDVVVLSSTSYEIRIYEPQCYNGHLSSVGDPFVVYRVEKGDSATSLKITRETRQKNSSTATGSPIVLTEQTSIERTGAWPNCTWVVKDWNVVGLAQQVTKTLVSSGDSNQVNETMSVQGPDGAVAKTTARTYQHFWWGYSLVSITEGTTNPQTTTIDYYPSTVDPELVKSRVFSGGGWEGFTYTLGLDGYSINPIDPPSGSPASNYTGRPWVRRHLKPYNGSPAAPPSDMVGATQGDITEYIFHSAQSAPVPFSWDNALTKRTINGVTVSNQTLDVSDLEASGDIVGHVRHYHQYSDSSQYAVETVVRSGTNPDFVAGRSSSDGSASWTYEQDVYWNGSSASFDSFNWLYSNAIRIVTFTGSSRSADGQPLFQGTAADVDITPIEIIMAEGDNGFAGEFIGLMQNFLYLVPNRSTKHVILRSRCTMSPGASFASEHIFRTEDYIWDGSTWNLVGWENFGYDTSCNLTHRENSKGEVWDAIYTGQLKQWEKDSTGTEYSYTYDPAGRVQTKTKAAVGNISALTTTYTYDAFGQVLTEVMSSASSAETITTSRTYDDAGRVTSEQVAGLSPTSYSYYPSALQTTKTLPSGATVVETRNSDGTLASQTGTGVVPAYYSYGVESDGRCWTRVDVASANSARWSKVWTDWLGHTVRTERPGAPNLANIVMENTYEGSTGHLLKSASTGLAPTLYVYGTMGQLVRTGMDIDGNGQLDLGGTDRITDMDIYFENRDGDWWTTQTTATYPYLNSDTAKTLSITRKRITGFSGTLRDEVHSIDAEGNETVQTTDVDSINHLVSVTTASPGMASSQVSQAVDGFPVSTTGYDGLTKTVGYDALLRLASAKDPRHSASGSMTYWPGTDLVLEITDAAGKRLSYTTYDTSGRPSVVYDAYNKTTRYAYNSLGLVTCQWGSAAYPVSYTYDSYGQRTKQRTYRDTSGSVAWDSSTWPGDSATADETEWVFDEPSGLLLKKYDPSRAFVEQTYNLRGQTYQRFWNRLTNPSDSTSPRVTTTYSYDDNTGELSSVSYNDGTPGISYSYTRLEQANTVTDATGSRSFGYDSSRPWRLANEALSSFYGSRTIGHSYDESTTTNDGESDYSGFTTSAVTGRPRGIAVTNPNQSGNELEASWAISNTGRIAGAYAGSHFGAGSSHFVYGYEPNSALLKTLSVVNNAFFITRDFEANRDLVTAIDTRWGSSSVSRHEYVYDDRAQRQSAVQSGSAFADYGDSIHQKFVHDDRGEVTTAATFLGSNAQDESNALSGRWHQFGYDAIGNREWSNTSGNDGTRDYYQANERNQYTSRENNTLSVGGVADPSAIVVAGVGSSGAAGRAGAHWGDNILLDNVGKPFYGDITFYSARSSTGSGYNDLVSSITKKGFLPPVAQSFTYDLDGNLTSDGVWNYQWDAENRLVRATTTIIAAAAGMPNRELDFVYDYLGRRVEKRVYNSDSQTQIFGRRYLYNGWNVIAEIENNAVIRSYTWGLDITVSMANAGGVGALVQIFDHRTDKAYFPGYDGNGNVSVLIDAASGSVVAAYEYSPFGESLRCEGSYATENVYRFSTKEVDDEIGLSYYGHRYYDPHNGRFINRDPSEETGGLNLYGFVANDPIGRWDVLGLSQSGSADTTTGTDDDRWKVYKTEDGGLVAKDSEGTVRMSLDGSSGDYKQYDANGNVTQTGNANDYKEWAVDSKGDHYEADYHYSPTGLNSNYASDINAPGGSSSRVEIDGQNRHFRTDTGELRVFEPFEGSQSSPELKEVVATLTDFTLDSNNLTLGGISVNDSGGGIKPAAGSGWGNVVVIYNNKRKSKLDAAGWPERGSPNGINLQRVALNTVNYYGNAIPAQSLRQAGKVMKTWGIANHSADYIAILDHGARVTFDDGTVQNKQMLGDNVLDPNDFRCVSSYLKTDGAIVLYGCKAGADPQYLQDVANAAGHRVYGVPDNVLVGRDEGMRSPNPSSPTWVFRDPTK